ncbi:MAG: FHA domain-containing protein [Deltaproteobacteria bacterium]
MFKLILEFQDTVVDDYTFYKIPVTIGRREDNDVVIDNMAVSGHHAVIEAEEPNYFVLVDLDSLNGTFLNEQKIGRERVFDGDSIIVGKHRLRFEDLRPERERPSREKSEEKEDRPPSEFRDTVILETKAQEELLAKQAEKLGYAADFRGYASDSRPFKAGYHPWEILGRGCEVLRVLCRQGRGPDQQEAQRILSLVCRGIQETRGQWRAGNGSGATQRRRSGNAREHPDDLQPPRKYRIIHPA